MELNQATMAHMHPLSIQSLQLRVCYVAAIRARAAGTLSCTWLPAESLRNYGTGGSTTFPFQKLDKTMLLCYLFLRRSRTAGPSWEQGATKNDKMRHLVSAASGQKRCLISFQLICWICWLCEKNVNIACSKCESQLEAGTVKFKNNVTLLGMSYWFSCLTTKKWWRQRLGVIKSDFGSRLGTAENWSSS